MLSSTVGILIEAHLDYCGYSHTHLAMSVYWYRYYVERNLIRMTEPLKLMSIDIHS